MSKKSKQSDPVVESNDTTATPVDLGVKKSTRLTEETILQKYPHVVPGSVRWETEGQYANKQTAEANLPCGHAVRIATSDLWQVKECAECHAVTLRERRKAKRHAKAEAKKAAKAAQAA